MLRVGLTGGIGCGKSTVAAIMRELGCHVIESDLLAHDIIAPGKPAYEEVLRKFGRDILTTDGRIDRARLAALVFNDPPRLALLNSIIHPLVLEECDRELDRLKHADPHGVAVIVAALLVEAGHHKRLDRLVVVTCTREQQIARLTDGSRGRGMTREEAERRIAAQMDLDEKRKLAQDEIDNSGTPEETRRQVAALVERLKRLATTTPAGD